MMEQELRPALALTYHDPPGRLIGLVEQALPLLTRLFAWIVIAASPSSSQAVLARFAGAGAVIEHDRPDPREISLRLGSIRSAAMRSALRFPAESVLNIDGDRVLHWAAHYPDELETVAARIPGSDCTVLGRSPRAFDSHPRRLRETEAPVNRLFASAAGLSETWDVMVGARGFSRKAAETLLAGCRDEAVSVDVSWPLHLLREGYRLQYTACDGLEFETADRSLPDIDARGGYQAWFEQTDLDPRQWAARFGMAQLHCEAIARYLKP